MDRSFLVQFIQATMPIPTPVAQKIASDFESVQLTKNDFVFQNAPLKHIASYLGVTDTSLSRIRKEIANK